MSDAVCKGVKFVGADGVEITIPLASNKNGEVVLTRDGFLKLVRGGLIVPSDVPDSTGTGTFYYNSPSESLKVYENGTPLTVPATRALFSDGGLYYFDNASGLFKIHTAKQRIGVELLTAQGSMIYASAAGTAAELAKGTTGQVLTMGATIPGWATLSGGKILQVVTNAQTTALSTTSGSFVDSTFGVTITPSATTSKVLVLAFLQFGQSGNANMGGQIRRGATDISPIAGTSLFSWDIGSQFNTVHVAAGIVDAPSTTSATTYKVYWKTGGGTSYMCRAGWTTAIYAPSYLIAMEVAA